MLSKSQYTKWRHCHKRLWLYKNKPQLATPPDKQQQKNFDIGNRIGMFARRRFAGGTLVMEKYNQIDDALAATRFRLQTDDTIYEAAFLYDDILIRVDILRKTPNGWDMIEVKSSTSVKAEHYADASVQAYVLQGAGIKLDKVFLMHIDSRYVREYDLDFKQFFMLEDLTEELTPPDAIKKEIAKIKDAMQQPQPQVQIGKSKCKDCEFRAYCWRDIPEDSVYNLPKIAPELAASLARSRMLKIADIPPEAVRGVNNRRWLAVYRDNKPYIDKQGIADLLAQLEYPLHFLDFETTMSAIPDWQGTRPYQQIVFQASLHVLESENAELKHYAYLFNSNSDPRPKAVEFLLEHIGDKGTIIAHNAQFEKARIAEMARDLYMQKDAHKLQAMLTRFWDTMIPFKKYYLHPDFHCSASIKKVLPVVAPGMTYEGMAIANGGDAMDAFDWLYSHGSVYAFAYMARTREACEKREKLRKDLLAYCAQDTLAMVKIVEFLKKQAL
jgi:CRISPR/Cas system-associated exonuclease Cas4 (RecB family)